MKNTNEKKTIAPNECSTLRWIAVLAVAFLIGIVGAMPLNSLLQNRVDTIMGIAYADFFGMLSFIPMFLGIYIAVRFLAKTTMKDFILGVGGKVDKKSSLIVLGLYAVGFAIPLLITVNNLQWRGVKADQFAFLLVFMLLTTWIQTTFEELIYRGVFLRWACKNKVGYTAKAFIAIAVSSAFFALSHVTNPEVTSKSGIDILIMMITYALPGAACFIVNIHFGTLLPGIIIHWLNNFLLFTLVSSGGSAVPVPTLLIDTTSQTAAWSFTSTLIAYVPVLAYVLFDIVRRKKCASCNEQ